VILNEQGFWRILVSVAIGAAAALIAAVAVQVRREPAVPLTAGVAAAATAYAIDWYSERKQPHAIE
jgi:anti-sigma-K factor RskA